VTLLTGSILYRDTDYPHGGFPHSFQVNVVFLLMALQALWALAAL
jgi:hypothetical protein